MNVHNHVATFVRGVVVRCLCVALIQIKSIRAVDTMRPYFFGNKFVPRSLHDDESSPVFDPLLILTTCVSVL